MDLLLLLGRVGAPVPDPGDRPMPDAGDPPMPDPGDLPMPDAGDLPTLTGPCPNPFIFFLLLCNKKVTLKVILSNFWFSCPLLKSATEYGNQLLSSHRFSFLETSVFYFA